MVSAMPTARRFRKTPETSHRLAGVCRASRGRPFRRSLPRVQQFLLMYIERMYQYIERMYRYNERMYRYSGRLYQYIGRLQRSNGRLYRYIVHQTRSASIWVSK